MHVVNVDVGLSSLSNDTSFAAPVCFALQPPPTPAALLLTAETCPSPAGGVGMRLRVHVTSGGPSYLTRASVYLNLVVCFLKLVVIVVCRCSALSPFLGLRFLDVAVVNDSALFLPFFVDATDDIDDDGDWTRLLRRALDRLMRTTRTYFNYFNYV